MLRWFAKTGRFVGLQVAKLMPLASLRASQFTKPVLTSTLAVESVVLRISCWIKSLGLKFAKLAEYFKPRAIPAIYSFIVIASFEVLASIEPTQMKDSEKQIIFLFLLFYFKWSAQTACGASSASCRCSPVLGSILGIIIKLLTSITFNTPFLLPILHF